MTTITAVELRKNMGEIMRRVERGEKFVVTYRNKTRVKLEPEHAKHSNNASGLDAFLAAPRKPSGLDPTKSFKELYHEHLEEKYGNHV